MKSCPVGLPAQAGCGGISAQEVWFSKKMMNHHGGFILIDGSLYGANGGNEGGALVCLDFKTGAVRWKERCVGKGSVMAADGHLYVRGEQGTVALVEVSPDAYKEKGRFRQPARSRFATFCHPVVSGGRLYLRDEDMLFCYDIKEGNEPSRR